MFDIWMGEINLGYVAVGVAAVMLVVQLLLCFKAKSKFVRLLPLGSFLLLGVLLLVIALLQSGWDSVGYVILALLVGMIALACCIGWGIWGIVAFRKKRRNAD